MNPFLSDSQFPLYNTIEPCHIGPAIRILIQNANTELLELEENLKNLGPDVKAHHLISRLERLKDPLHRAWAVCQHLSKVKSSDGIRLAMAEVQPDYVSFEMRVAQNKVLFSAFRAVRDSEQWDGLSEPEQRIISAEIRDAELAGVALSESSQERFTEIQKRCAALCTKFGNNVLDATNAFTYFATTEEDVDGIPALTLAQAAQVARNQGIQYASTEAGPWHLRLDLGSFRSVMQFAKNRAVRERIYKAYVTRASELGYAGEGVDPATLDNTPIIDEVLALRRETARLLGKANYAECCMASKMATVDSATKLQDEFAAACRGPAQAELDELRAFAAARGLSGELQPWDTAFYAEALREERFAFSQEELRQYFPLDRVLHGLFALAGRLFGITVAPAAEPPPVWHPDVQFWVVHSDGAPVAYFYLDPYARPGEKDSGAWFWEVASRSRALAPPGAAVRLPVACIVCNQSPPVGGAPSLMTLAEVTTLFHEFGHSLQHMLTAQELSAAAGLRGVEWDAVELPSQFMENWCYDKPTIDGLARHHATGEPIPETLWARVRAAKTFRAASDYLPLLHRGAVDLALHVAPAAPAAPGGVHGLFLAAGRSMLPLAPAECDRFLCAFLHVFSGKYPGYIAGYYSYLWAEVLSADCFALFEEAGLGDDAAVRAAGRRFRETVLGLGGGAAPGRVFELFRGRGPRPDALLRHLGLAS